MNYTFIGVIVFCLVILYLLIWIFIKPFKVFAKVILNSAIGALLMWGYNIAFAKLGLVIGINVWSALVCGILGIPGFAMLGVGSYLLS